MTYSCCLTDENVILALDASVIINLYASGAFEQIIQVLPNRVVVVENVVNELTKEFEGELHQQTLLLDLERKDVLFIQELEERELDTYVKMLSEPNSLDDGEAATITLCRERNYLPVIDERKGALRYREENCQEFMDIPSSLDLFIHPAVMSLFGQKCISDMVYEALKKAKMRVRVDQLDLVLDLIGDERAAQCNSLPNFKELRKRLLSTSSVG